MNLKHMLIALAAFCLLQPTIARSEPEQPPAAVQPSVKSDEIPKAKSEGKDNKAVKPGDKTAAKSGDKDLTPGATDELSVDQARLADRYKRLEEVVGRLAELSAGSDPRRAKLLRDAMAQSREQDVNVRFESVVKLLQDERLSAASTNQVELQKELDSLLTLLLKADRDKELNSERDRVKLYLKEVGRIIRDQKGVRARTENGDDLKVLKADQQRLAGDTGKLGGNISDANNEKKAKDGSSEKNGDKSKPSDGKKSDGEKSDGNKDGNKSDGKKSDGEKSDGNKSDGKKSDGKKSDGKNPDSKQPGDKNSDDKSSKPDGKPGDKPQPGDRQSKSPDGQPSDGKQSQGQPGKPSQSNPSQQGPPGQQSEGGENNDEQQQPQDPADKATEQLRKAKQQMEEAIKKLSEVQRKGAVENQQEALKQLEIAKAELERILRQLREEEMERTLTQLAARFRKMLEMQTAVYEGTVRLDQVAVADRTHDNEIESARLSRQESLIAHEADKALALLREEGSSVAFPETVEQTRDDMRQVTERLAAIKVDKLTQSIEKDIIASLEETIAALDKSIKDLEKKRTPPGKQAAAGEPGDQPLVEKLAELKMIRALEMRIYKRTQRYGEMIKGDQAETPELIKSLQDLAEKQQRVYKATADLQQDRNE